MIEYLSSFTTLSEPFIQEITKWFKTEHYKSHQILHAPGQTENRLWFIKQGFARTYYFDRSGREHTLHFYNLKDFIFSYQGLWKESSDYYIEVLDESELLSAPYEQIMNWLDAYPEAKIISAVLSRHRYHQELFKARLMTWSAEERYVQYRKFDPDVFRKASLRLIASYLNMTRENLSRLMGRET